MAETTVVLPLGAPLAVRSGAEGTPGATNELPGTPLVTNGFAMNGLDSATVNGYAEGQDSVQRRPGIEHVATLAPSLRPRGIAVVTGRGGDTTAVICDGSLMLNPEPNIRTGELWEQIGVVGPWTSTSADEVKIVAHSNFFVVVDGINGDVFSSANGDTWTTQTLTGGWSARRDFALVSDGTFIYMIGGIDAALAVNRSDVWRTSNLTTWTQVYAGALPTGVGCRHPSVAHDSVAGALYWGFGGTAAAAGGTSRRISISTDLGVTWSAPASNTLESVGGHSIGMFPETVNGVRVLILFGGDGNRSKGVISYVTVAGIANIETIITKLPGGDMSCHWRNGLDGRIYGTEESAPIVRFTPSTFATTVTPGAPITATVPQVAAPVGDVPGGIAYNSTTNILLGLNSATTTKTIYRGHIARSPAGGFFNGLFPNGFDADDLLQYVSMDQYPPAIVNSRSRIEPPFEGFFFKSRKDAYFFNLGNSVISKVVDEDYPQLTTDGVAVLNGRVYVATPNGQIHNSEVNDPANWPAVNFISAQAQPDRLTALTRRFGYIGAMGETSIEWFQDIGSAVGTPLLPVDSAVSDYGCAHGRTVVRLADTVMFVGRGAATGERAVFALNGYSPQKVSTPSVDRLLATYPLDTVAAYAAYIGGHLMYVVDMAGVAVSGQLGLGSAGAVSIAYDITTQQWHLWNTYKPQELGTIGLGTTILTPDATGYTRVDMQHSESQTTANGLVVGDLIEIRNATPDAYNGEWLVDTSTPASSQFSVLMPTSPGALTVIGQVNVLRNAPSTTSPTVTSNGYSFRVPISHSAFGKGFQVAGSDSASQLLLYPTNVGTGTVVWPTLARFNAGQFVDNWLGREPRFLAAQPTVRLDQAPVQMFIRTPRWDGGTNTRKFVSYVDLVADQRNVGTEAWLRHSDNDRREWSVLSPFDTGAERARIYRQGSTRRRTYDLRVTDRTQTARVERLEAFTRLEGPGG